MKKSLILFIVLMIFCFLSVIDGFSKNGIEKLHDTVSIAKPQYFVYGVSFEKK